jgi:hypothetical protein
MKNTCYLMKSLQFLQLHDNLIELARIDIYEYNYIYIYTHNYIYTYICNFPKTLLAEQNQRSKKEFTQDKKEVNG